MQISSDKGFCSFTLGLAHEKNDVWNGPKIWQSAFVSNQGCPSRQAVVKIIMSKVIFYKIPTRPQFAHTHPPRTPPPPFATPLYILCISCINMNVPHQNIFQNRYISIYISIHVEGNLSDLLNMANSGQQTDNWQSLVFGDPYYTYSIYGL